MIVRDIWMGMIHKITIYAAQPILHIFVCAKTSSMHDRALTIITRSGVVLVVPISSLAQALVALVNPAQHVHTIITLAHRAISSGAPIFVGTAIQEMIFHRPPQT